MKIKDLWKYTAGSLFRNRAPKLRKALILPGEESWDKEGEHRSAISPPPALEGSEPPAQRSLGTLGSAGGLWRWEGLKVRCMAFRRADTMSH